MTTGAIGRRVLLGAAAGLALSAPAFASAGRRVVTLLVGAPAGTPPDLRARSMVPFLARHWPRITLAVENTPGAGGLEAARAVAEAQPGRALLGLVSTPALLARCIQDAEPGLPDRLAWFGPLTDEPLVLVAAPEHAELRLVSTVQPARLIGTGPAGSASHLAALRIALHLPDTQVLPFASAMAARRAAASGHVAAAVLPLPDLRRSTRPGVVVIASATAARLPGTPQVPTLTERGIPVIAGVQRGFVARAGFVQAAALAGAVRALRADPDFAGWAEETGAAPGTGEPTGWAERLLADRRELASLWSQAPWAAGG
jgi:tripartite-type tricarboxylate transporter receptor subunit TctC